ncbi:hypothetical protein [Halobellus sp. GM3]|uniref:hypothetical protein n=1 Tax=Halobellus sp. GM3 TaxID=3458410 RepID=UPI00403DD20F
MPVNARLVALGAVLLLASSGLLFEAGVSDPLAVTVAATAVCGAGLALVRSSGADGRAA